MPDPIARRAARGWRWLAALAAGLTRQMADGTVRRETPHAPKAFLRHLAHELNNVLSVTLSGADIIRDAANQGEARAATVSIAAAALEGLDLTARMAAVARQDDLVPSPCDIAGTLAACRPRLERAAGGGARLRLELTNRPLAALIDRDQFLACIVEMLMEVRAASNQGVLVVRTRLTERVGPRSEAALGVMIEVEADRGSAGRSELTRDHGGIAIAAGFAEQSGGAFEQAQSGSLSRATLRLPLLSTGRTAAPGDFDRVHRASRLLPAARVLVVEDNDLLRGVLVRGLRERGLDVHEAQDAVEAQRLFGSATAALITDVVLPGGMDGFALARWARARDPRVALLFVSAFISSRLPEVLASDELASFVRKPIDLEGLLAVLAGLLAVRDEHVPPGEPRPATEFRPQA